MSNTSIVPEDREIRLPLPKTYSVQSIFHTIQGEGYHSGTSAVFVRFKGCNIWSGREEHRQRDTKNGSCAAWCDTDFVSTGRFGGQYSRADLAEKIADLCVLVGTTFIVFTGGEPLLQLDAELLEEVKLRLRQKNASHDAYFAVETNGTVEVSKALAETVQWFTVSPKTYDPLHPSFTDDRHGFLFVSELKVVFPALDPRLLPTIHATHQFITPWDTKTLMRDEVLHACGEFVKTNPDWRLSLQLHKILGIE